ncbi:alpha/beta hydrolase family protein [Pontixanthobacter luteolus]|uniref:alpha/beta hydrolase family protein n=1 Tax=Pontixanthobacter luteolus TaxID=295089 RepID=UPI002302DEC6|nr:S9 family peptidase [Pontixanthobacter luteolus]
MHKFEKVSRATVAAGLALISLSPLAAQTLEDDAARFGARQSILSISLSPSGDKIVYISPNGTSGEKVMLVDLGAQGPITPKTLLADNTPNVDIDSCMWATDQNLVCYLYSIVEDSSGRLLGFERAIGVNIESGEATKLTAETSSRALYTSQRGGSIVAFDVETEPNKIAMTRAWVEEWTNNTRLANTKSGLGVDLVDVNTGKRDTIEQPDESAVAYIADDKGRIRLKVLVSTDNRGRSLGRRVYLYRPADSDDWERLSTAVFDGVGSQGFRPVAIDSGKDVAYGFMDQDGFTGVYSLGLSADSSPKPVKVRDDVDVDSLVRIGRQRRVVGVSYATEKRRVEFFDDNLANLTGQLQNALPGNPAVGVAGASADEQKLLIIASSDVDPGMVYLFDKNGSKLQELLPLRNALSGQDMAEMKPVTFPARDGTEIPGYLTLPNGPAKSNLPAIVLPHGGPSSRDEWGFDWLVQFFAARGYAVLQPNYRGSSGYGRAWFGRNGFKSWKTAVNDINDAGSWLVSEGIADGSKLAIVGWSYGGYAALQSQVVSGNPYGAVVAIAPVTDLEKLKNDSLGFTNERIMREFIGAGPHIKEGSPAQNVDRFTSPVLMFHGTSDQNVEVRQSRHMADRLKDAGKPVDYVEYEDLAHNLSDSAARADMLQRIGVFLDQNLGD